jgi:hypothetical protein
MGLINRIKEIIHAVTPIIEYRKLLIQAPTIPMLFETTIDDALFSQSGSSIEKVQRDKLKMIPANN